MLYEREAREEMPAQVERLRQKAGRLPPSDYK